MHAYSIILASFVTLAAAAPAKNGTHPAPSALAFVGIGGEPATVTAHKGNPPDSSVAYADAPVFPIEHSEFHVDIVEPVSAAALPNRLVVCTGKSCNGSCYYTKLSALKEDVCYKSKHKFHSAFIVQKSNAGLSYSIYATESDANCHKGTLYRIPTVNECYRFPLTRDGFVRS